MMAQSKEWTDLVRQDPKVPDWENVHLPDTWPDRLRLYRPDHFLKLLAHVLGKPSKLELPEDLPGREALPEYLLQEFHRMPNGNYSNSMTHGYIRGFEPSMLGTLKRIISRQCNQLRSARTVLDIGCGGGRLAGALADEGVPDVWGLDASPYLLKHAARHYRKVSFVQGLVEQLPFPDARFDAVCCYFLFHELPKQVADRALDECYRVLNDDGYLLLSEPSPEQLQIRNPFKLLRLGGPTALYFRILAQFVYEPFITQWHERDHIAWFETHGFDVTMVHDFPFRHFHAHKRSSRPRKGDL